MGAPLFLPRRGATQQWAAAPRIDWTNPLTRGLRLAFSAGSQIDLATGKVSSAGVPALSATTDGLIAGPFNAAPYPSFSTFPVKQSGAFTVVAYGQFRYCGGKGPILSHYGGSGGWKFSIFNNNFSYTQYGVADYTLSTVAAGYTGVVVAVVTPGVNIKIYTNGILSETVAIGAMSASSGNGTLVIGNRSGGTDTALGSSQLASVLYFENALNDAQIASISANPWQVFAAPTRTISTAAVAPAWSAGGIAPADGAAALGTAISLTATAIAAASGAAALTTQLALAAIGSASTSSAAALSTGLALAAAGTSAAAGNATLASTAAPWSATGAAAASGSASLSSGIALAAAAAAPATGSAILATQVALAASGSAATSASATLSTAIALAAAAGARADGSAAITTAIALAATGSARTTGRADIAGVAPASDPSRAGQYHIHRERAERRTCRVPAEKRILVA